MVRVERSTPLPKERKLCAQRESMVGNWGPTLGIAKERRIATAEREGEKFAEILASTGPITPCKEEECANLNEMDQRNCEKSGVTAPIQAGGINCCKEVQILARGAGPDGVCVVHARGRKRGEPMGGTTYRLLDV